MQRYVISVYVETKYGVVARVSGLFMRRGFNIDSLTVGATDNPGFSRITVAIDGDANAALLAVQMLAIEDNELYEKLCAKRQKDAEAVLQKDAGVLEKLK